jgi:hypothetical protein
VTPFERRRRRLRNFNSPVEKNDPRLAAEASVPASEALNETSEAAPAPQDLERNVALESIILPSSRPVFARKRLESECPTPR